MSQDTIGLYTTDQDSRENEPGYCRISPYYKLLQDITCLVFNHFPSKPEHLLPHLLLHLIRNICLQGRTNIGIGQVHYSSTLLPNRILIKAAINPLTPTRLQIDVCTVSQFATLYH